MIYIDESRSDCWISLNGGTGRREAKRKKTPKVDPPAIKQIFGFYRSILWFSGISKSSRSIRNRKSFFIEERWIFEFFFLSLLEGESSLFGNSQQGRLSLIRKIFHLVPYSKVDYSMVVPIYLSRSRCHRQWKPVSHAFCLYQELLWSGGLSPYTNPLSIWLHTACLSSHSCPTYMRIFFTNI